MNNWYAKCTQFSSSFGAFYLKGLAPLANLILFKMKKIYLLLALFVGFQFSYGQLIINEVLYDPSNNNLDGDANGDGVYSQNDDSFIELYNNSSTAFDISGYQIWDDTSSAGTNQFTFPANTLVPANEAIVVFGGGTITGTFGNAVVLSASTGLNFDNSGEVIGIKDANGSWALLFDSDALSNNPNESYTRYPDVTGAFIQHSDSTALLFSPGTRTDGTAFSSNQSALIINEVLYDPSNSGLDGDANGDGVYSQDDDSFIEIYNPNNSAFDISGYEIWDDTTSGGTNQYTFPANTLVPANEAVVVFGGGTLTGTFGTALVLNAVNGFNFNNSGEVIGIKDANGNWVLFFDSDALSNNPNESYTRFPDISGPFLQHGDTTTVLFSPGTRTNGTAFSTLSGIQEKNQSVSLKVYPNPTEGILNIETSEKIERIDIFNITGVLVKSYIKLNAQIDVSDLPSGVFMLRANTQNGTTTYRFVRK